MYMINRYNNSCTARDGKPKTRYATEGEALNRSDEILQKDGVKTRCYKCNHCEYWHLTRLGVRQLLSYSLQRR